MKKFTNKEVLGMVVAVVTGTEVENKEVMLETLGKMIEQLDKKQENKKLTKAQQENLEIKERLLALLQTKETGLNISQIQEVAEFSEYSNQKLSALLNQMVKAEELTKEVGKDRKTVFKATLVVAEEVQEEEQKDLTFEHEYALMLNSLFTLEKKVA